VAGYLLLFAFAAYVGIRRAAARQGSVGHGDAGRSLLRQIATGIKVTAEELVNG